MLFIRLTQQTRVVLVLIMISYENKGCGRALMHVGHTKGLMQETRV